MMEVARLQRQMFYSALDQCYQIGQLNPHWKAMTTAIEENCAAINENCVAIIRYWSDSQKTLWKSFIPPNHSSVSAICKEIKNGDASLADVLEKHRINENHHLYEEILVELFSTGSKNIYRDEQALFLTSLNKSDTRTKQSFVTGFIKSGSLDVLDEISIKIYEEMGTYKTQPTLWQEVDLVVKEQFHQWYLGKSVREFFLGTDQDRERFVYWKKFIPRMTDAYVLENERTILFYFSDIVIMEVSGTGAVYVYESAYFNERFGPLVTRYRESKALKEDGSVQPRLTRRMLMDKAAVVKGGWLSHSRDWQKTFDKFLKENLNWEVDKNE